MSFADLGLSDKVLQAVSAAGYSDPTPIQAQAIPHVLARRDVLGIAQTGTGKTAAFVLPMLTLLETGRARARMPRTLIMEPTRELAAQVVENFERYGINHKLNVALLIGGVSFGDQDMKITRGVDVLIATPGRLLDHFERGKLLLTGVELLVIDEADRMLDMGFIPDIERIVKLVPFTRQTLFFSATMPPEIQHLADNFLHNPVRAEASRPASAASTITQRLFATGSEGHEKRERLRELIPHPRPTSRNAIIFCNRKREVATLHKSPAAARLQRGRAARRPRPAGPHGSARELPDRRGAAAGRQRRRGARARHPGRQPHLQLRRASPRRGLTCNRIGRTGRAGRSGHAFTLVAPGDERSLAAIESLMGPRQSCGRDRTSPNHPTATGAPARAARGGRRGERREPPRRSEATREAPVRADRTRERKRPEDTARTEPRASALSDTRTSPPATEASDRPSRRSDRSPRRDDAPRAPARSRSVPDRPRGSHAETDGPDGVVGLGDHVPAFLMRNGRPKPEGR